MQASLSPQVIAPAIRTAGPIPRIYLQPEINTAVLEPDVCSEGIFLAVVVCSALGNQLERQAIRETWGSITRNQPDVMLVFLVGKHSTSEFQERVEAESRNYSDIIQEDFLDTYDNLTLKTLFMLKWTIRACAHVNFVLKTDDDMFINVPNLLHYLRTLGGPRMLLGSFIEGAKPDRSKNSKWFEPSSYVDNSYPAYLSGTAYVIAGDLLSDLYGVALDTPLSRLEDVFLTGVCAERLGLSLTSNTCFHYEDLDYRGCRARRIFSAHRVNPEQLYSVWEELHNPELYCENTVVKYFYNLIKPFYC